MKWTKQGRVYDGSRRFDWAQSHGMIPTADHIEGDVYRVYFSPRDEQNRSNTGYVDIDVTNPTEILAMSTEPVLPCGELGGFDDSGALASWIVNENDRKYMYYIGYNIGVTVTFRNFIGLATSDDGGRTWRKHSRAPVVGRTEIDPLLAVTPCVLKDDGVWKMWYTTATRWDPQPDDKPKHYYHIKYAESEDGLLWDPTGTVCIDYKSDAEYAIARPSVLRDGDVYRMWFCCRGDKYRLGYAESANGKDWERMDERAGMTVSDSGWDSEMIAYPFVFRHKEQICMLYNGNGYGQTGFGFAVLEE